jgi:hypothetical protein
VTAIPPTIVCIQHLLDQVPELRPLYEEHLHDYDELLPHVFLGDVTRYVVQQVRSGDTCPSKLVKRILESLEQCMASGDERAKELVSVSFIENLANHSDVLAKLYGQLGPNLSTELKNHGI